MALFSPRRVFTVPDSLPRSYFLGHHRAGLNRMKSLISQIDLVLECRDYRLPITSRNPLFEDSLEGKTRLVIYTKRDLGSNGAEADRRREDLMRLWHKPDDITFSDHKDPRSAGKILDYFRRYCASNSSLTGSRAMVVGMPNVGKSSLLNTLRQHGVHRGKAVRTGGQPGITRSIETSVKILEGEHDSDAFYLVDTPGVFIPYVSDGESMLKLALCGSVKDTIIPPTIVADYLLYQINLHDPAAYSKYSEPTNDVDVLLAAIARQTGRLQRGGEPDLDATALWLIQRWRTGDLGKFLLDEVTLDNLQASHNRPVAISFTQARKQAMEARRRRSKNPI